MTKAQNKVTKPYFKILINTIIVYSMNNTKRTLLDIRDHYEVMCKRTA